eukprot:CAMPEP_0202347326 /NCGR_PEP_ID=MMETSP1126-20121109/5734_1 /ASSEMBLY_ACC=CAM_ASM_000457 /TAXON_ID=3047 /ORGANISM="Dunaliella tertiolecta, Strain CCMP1320" /LENGTH=110 /DNA_ID=CAMNT_0048938857 /DNA_START=212 /DNA_END=545 /DNA_ORIENTATION=+
MVAADNGKSAQQATSKPPPQLERAAQPPPQQPQETKPPAEGPAQQASTRFGPIDSQLVESISDDAVLPLLHLLQAKLARSQGGNTHAQDSPLPDLGFVPGTEYPEFPVPY